MKKCATAFPSFGYVAYIDPLPMHKDFIANGAKWMMDLDVDIVVVKEGVSNADVARHLDPNVRVISKNEIVQQLNKITDTNLKSRPNNGAPRKIFITKHSKEQDERVSKILGGVFLKSEDAK